MLLLLLLFLERFVAFAEFVLLLIVLELLPNETFCDEICGDDRVDIDVVELILVVDPAPPTPPPLLLLGGDEAADEVVALRVIILLPELTDVPPVSSFPLCSMPMGDGEGVTEGVEVGVGVRVEGVGVLLGGGKDNGDGAVGGGVGVVKSA